MLRSPSVKIDVVISPSNQNNREILIQEWLILSENKPSQLILVDGLLVATVRNQVEVTPQTFIHKVTGK
jgi:hypothetical protein